MTDPTFVLEEFFNRANNFVNLNGLINREQLAFRGGVAVVHQGTLTTTGSRVAVKTVQRRRPGDVKIIKKVLREAHVWSKLDHANVLPFIGITSDFEVSISLVSKWMASGDAHQYVQDETIDPRPLVVCIARGLHYLHNYPQGPIVHGDLKGANVLISDEGHALISDFGYTHLTNSSFDMTVSVPCGGTINWMAPEVLKPPEQKDPCLTVESDVWAFGMTILELFTRKAPFSYLKNIGTIVYQIVNAPPDRPRDDSTCYRMTYDWWAVCSDCWKSDPASRPSMLHLVNRIEGIKAIKDLTLGLNILSEKATSLGINLGFDQITRNIDVTTGSDGNAIVFQGVLQPGGKKLAVKNIRTGPLAANVHIVEEILRDVLLWSKVQHKNVIPVLGITTKFDHTLSIVSEWTEMKNAYDYVQNSEVDPRPLLLEIANGLEYLHTHQDHPLIHGDLRGINVFVSHEGHALIAFGITSLVNRLFEAPATRSRPLNWVAPEGLDNGGFTTTRQGDVWAFGMTALELFTRRPPFHDTESDIKAEVMRGPPERPSDEATHGRLTRMWWQGCLSCWNHEPLLRPTMTMIVKRIDQIMHTPEHSPPSSVYPKLYPTATSPIQWGIPLAAEVSNHFLVSSDLHPTPIEGIFNGTDLTLPGPFLHCPSSICLYVGEDGMPCLVPITCGNVPAHMIVHGIKGIASNATVTCRWVDCGLNTARYNFVRHVREVHLYHPRRGMHI